MLAQKKNNAGKLYFLQFIAAVALLPMLSGMTMAAKFTATTSSDVAVEVDRTISEELRKSETPLSQISNDEDFLRRISLDLIGTTPSANEVTIFGLNPDSKKRTKLIEKLLKQKAFARNWSGYWSEVIYSHATEARARLGQNAFEDWMTEQLHKNRSWGEIASEMITASGNVQENGETALIYAHNAQAPEIAAEASRIFMGIQMSCANCHDHPTDKWTRDDFHSLAAYFPRMRITRDPKSTGRRSFYVASADQTRGRRGKGRDIKPEQIFKRFDKNKDKKLSKKEVKGSPLARLFDRILQNADKNKDKMVSLKEFKAMPKPNNNRNRGSSEYYMPNLKDPSSKGTQMEPVFFVNETETKSGLKDMDRRDEFAKLLTSRTNPWFAKAFVNRIWHEMLGEGFYMPVDDIGPERQANFPEALEVLATAFTANDYDVKWLYRTIANTQTYQRSIRARDASDLSLPFAAATATRLRSDQIFNSLTKVLGADQVVTSGNGGRFQRSAKSRFATLFGFDPSTPQEDILGNVPQALFMMNSNFINSMITTDRDTRLARILKKYNDDEDATNELYLLVLSRDPSEKETNIFKEYRKKITNRNEAYEDLMWSLLNSSEFLSKR